MFLSVAAMPPLPPMPGMPMGMHMGMHMKCNESDFGDWETSKCVWPTETEVSDLPDSCSKLPPKPEKLPEVVYKVKIVYSFQGNVSFCGTNIEA